MKVTPRARSRDDRAGDPLDGLVNLFDLGIVLSRLPPRSPLLPRPDRRPHVQVKDRGHRPVDAVVAEKDQRVKEIQLKPGERVVGRGEPIGTVYRLADGRTVIVRSGSR